MEDSNDSNEETNRANELRPNRQVHVIIESIDSSDGETEVELPQVVQPRWNSATNPALSSYLYETNTPRKLHYCSHFL